MHQVNILIYSYYMNMQNDTYQSTTHQGLIGEGMLMARYARTCIPFDPF